MKRGAVSVLAVLLVVVLLVPLPAAAWGVRGGGLHHFHHFHHFHRFHHHHVGPFFFGFGVGALVTAPFWYPPAYAYPGYPAPYSAPPPPVYWYYCQDPPGYYPYVPQCPGGWLTVVPPGSVQ